MTITEEMIAEDESGGTHGKQQKQILEWLQYAYIGARAYDDLDTMTRISRAMKAFGLPVSKDVVIGCKEES